MNTLSVIGTLALEKANQPFFVFGSFLCYSVQIYVPPSVLRGGECLTDRNEDKRREIRPDLAQVSRLWDFFHQ